MSTWLIRMHNGVAYIYKRKYWMNMIAVPWRFAGGTNIIRTPDIHNDVGGAALSYISKLDATASVEIRFESWR